MSQDIAALGDAVRRRREQLHLSQEDVAAIGGPSTTTLSKIENGEASGIRKRTALDLDDALRWERGSAEAVLAGGRPTPLALGAGRSRHEGDARQYDSRRYPRRAVRVFEASVKSVLNEAFDVEPHDVDELTEAYAALLAARAAFDVGDDLMGKRLFIRAFPLALWAVQETRVWLDERQTEPVMDEIDDTYDPASMNQAEGSSADEKRLAAHAFHQDDVALAARPKPAGGSMRERWEAAHDDDQGA